ncbi:hypothetical protein HPB49_002142 [Dermacentor silvarum]|uniref:Uncharacterized protein n=1 Tax=Dermacentor silvarum TaxID=543639 RepID=A0ACB8CP19_DERSI|nr:hypothetical protein HPB49_002142 [Dermacentor silvarum]
MQDSVTILLVCTHRLLPARRCRAPVEQADLAVRVFSQGIVQLELRHPDKPAAAAVPLVKASYHMTANAWLGYDSKLLKDGDRVNALRLRTNLYPTTSLTNRARIRHLDHVEDSARNRKLPFIASESASPCT